MFEEEQVVSAKPIGTLQRISGQDGGFRRRTVIETETGFYTVRGLGGAIKGTPLTLELRASGALYICAPARRPCLPTAIRRTETAQEQDPGMGQGEQPLPSLQEGGR